MLSKHVGARQQLVCRRSTRTNVLRSRTQPKHAAIHGLYDPVERAAQSLDIHESLQEVCLASTRLTATRQPRGARGEAADGGGDSGSVAARAHLLVSSRRCIKLNQNTVFENISHNDLNGFENISHNISTLGLKISLTISLSATLLGAFSYSHID
jgi:hypothetical protein